MESQSRWSRLLGAGTASICSVVAVLWMGPWSRISISDVILLQQPDRAATTSHGNSTTGPATSQQSTPQQLTSSADAKQPDGLAKLTRLTTPTTSTAPSLVLRGVSTADWHYDPRWHSPAHNPLHQQSSFVVLRNIRITRFAVETFGLGAEWHGPLRNLTRYRVYPPDPPAKMPFVFEFKEAKSDGVRCGRVIMGPALLVPPHIPANAFHLHNDMMLKVAWLLMTAQLRPAETTLLLFKGSVSGPANLFELLPLLLREMIHPAESALAVSGGLCFRHLLWTPSLSWPMHAEPLYFPTLPSWHWERAVGFWVDTTVLAGLGVERAGTGTSTPELLWIQRTGSRRITNFDSDLLPALRKRFTVSVLGSGGRWERGRAALVAMLGKLQRADVVGGYHGAGLLHILYARKGAVVVELKGKHGFAGSFFHNIAMVRRQPYYVADVRRYTVGSGEVFLPRSYIEKLCADLHANVLHHRKEDVGDRVFGAEPGWQHNGPGCPYGEQLVSWQLPRDGALSPPRLSRCYLQRRVLGAPKFGQWQAADNDGRSSPSSTVATALWRAALKAVGPDGKWKSGTAPGVDIRDVCNQLQHGQLEFAAFSDIAPAVSAQHCSWTASSGHDWLGNAVPYYFLPRAIAVLAQVPHVRVLSPGPAEHPDFLLAMMRRVYMPSLDSWQKDATQRLRQAAERGCRCAKQGMHTCNEPGLWEAFQTFWRPELRDGLLDYLDSRPQALNASDDAADLAVHLRCGDVLKDHERWEYGYLPLSAYRRALQGRVMGSLLRIRVITAPLEGVGVRQKDMKVRGTCEALAHGLKKLLEETFKPAEVVVDRTPDHAIAWARLVFAKRTLCSPSTYCLFPTMAANDGFLGDSQLFFSRSYPDLKGVTYLRGIPFLSMPHIMNQRLGATEIVSWIASH